MKKSVDLRQKRFCLYLHPMICFCLMLSIFFCGCSSSQAQNSGAVKNPSESSIQQTETTDSSVGQNEDSDSSKSEQKPNENTPISQQLMAGSSAPVSVDEIPAYSGSPYTVLNNNNPWFEEENETPGSWEEYQPLDALGRTLSACACLGQDLMPLEERESISSVHPSGFDNQAYDFIDGEYVYNRCHLIGFQLSAENANPSNLITGTRYMNVQGMLPFENMTADYIRETDNHVLYRVTPIYEGNDLVAKGVVMEARSLEDDGDGIEFCVFCYNVQPGVAINYADGSNELDINSGYSDVSSPSQTASTQSDEIEIHEAQEETITYILNSNTHKFHKPDCDSVSKMKEKNKVVFEGARQMIIDQGYSPCKICNP